MKHSILIIIVILALGLGVACTNNQILGSLEGALAATQITLGVLEVENPANISLYSQISNSISDLPTAFQETVSELSTTDTQVVKYAKIASYFGPTISNIDALPPEARAIVSGLMQAIRSFLDSLQAPSTLTTIKTRQLQNNEPSMSLIVPGKDLSTIFNITERLSKIREKAIRPSSLVK